jgi:hypothetical protein
VIKNRYVGFTTSNCDTLNNLFLAMENEEIDI